MAAIGGGKIASFGGSSEVTLSDPTSNFEIKDQDGFIVAKIDATGNLYLKGGVKKV